MDLRPLSCWMYRDLLIFSSSSNQPARAGAYTRYIKKLWGGVGKRLIDKRRQDKDKTVLETLPPTSHRYIM